MFRQTPINSGTNLKQTLNKLSPMLRQTPINSRTNLRQTMNKVQTKFEQI